MKIFIYMFMLLSLVTVSIAVVFYVGTFYGIVKYGLFSIDCLGDLSLITFVPAGVLLNSLIKDAPVKKIWKVALRGCRSWMIWVQRLVVLFLILNALIFMYFNNGAEKHFESPEVVRVLAAFSILFGYTSFLILFSKSKINQAERAN